MAEIDLSKYGITGTTEIIHNPSYELLFEEETSSKNEGYEVGKESELGAVDVMGSEEHTSDSSHDRQSRMPSSAWKKKLA